MKRLIYLIALLGLSIPVFGQVQNNATPTSSSGSLLMDITVIIFIITSIVLLIIALALLHTFKVLSKEVLNPSPVLAVENEKLLEWDEWQALQKHKPGIWSKILGLRPISEEKDIMLDHEFDGISELDNPTPAWFMWLFYVTIAFGGVYLLNYHVFGWGKMQEEEYAAEMTQAQADKDAFLAKSDNKIDENSVQENKSDAVVSAGAAIFKTNCIACHGDKGQGTVGPNLTDKYWLHGGSINNIFKTIKYGVPEKGMISWEKTLTPKQIAEVSNYIFSIKGTNPPNPKAPQGEKEG